MKSNSKNSFWILTIASATLLIVAPFVGAVNVKLHDLFTPNQNSAQYVIFWSVRLPRVFMAFLAGGLLACAGLVTQVVFRNPLASPFTLGISSGAAFGAALFLLVANSLNFTVSGGQTLWALVGAFVAGLLVSGFGSMRKQQELPNLVIAGLVANFFFSSAVVLLQYVSDPAGVFRMVRWLMGGVESADLSSLMMLTALGLPALIIFFIYSEKLDVLSLGEEMSFARGVDPIKFRKIIFVLLSLLIGGVVSLCGPIGFIDIVVPQFARRIFGYNHRALLPASFVVGGLTLLVCDTLARTVMFPAELPAGVVAALIAGPAFLWLIMTGKGAVNA